MTPATPVKKNGEKNQNSRHGDPKANDSKVGDSKAQKQIGYVVSHTHWDREWRYPLWTTRSQFVRFMDHLLDLFEKEPRYKHFLLDGQTVAVEDYLQIRPEMREHVMKAVKSGKLMIGPWYTLPDEFPVDGECLVRNLLKGTRLADSLGGNMNLAYASFGWGQTAQLPQIYAGFGMDVTLFGKSVSKKRAPESEFMWESPDGTRILATRLGKEGRAGFYMYAHLPIVFGDAYISSGWEFDWRSGGMPYRPADEESRNMDYFRAWPPTRFHGERLKEYMEAVWDTVEETTVKGHRFMGDGSDFTEAEPLTVEIIEQANKAFPDKEFRHASLKDYFEVLKQEVDYKKLRTVHGEMRDGPMAATSGNALATRSFIKRKNRFVQNRLIRMAEPFATLASALGAEYPRQFLNFAWNYLLKSHPHDSINGVTQDKTVDDVMYRLSQAEEIARVVENSAEVELLKRIDLKGDPSDINIVLFNSLPFKRSEVLKIIADTPQENDIAKVTITEEGQELPVQRMSRMQKRIPESDANSRPRPYFADRHTLYVDAGEIPAGGYKVLQVKGIDTQPRKMIFWPKPDPKQGDILVSPNVMENEFLKVIVHHDGTFDVCDKLTGKLFAGLHYFEDGGDTGDYWVRSVPAQDSIFVSKGCPVRTWVEDHGHLSATMVVEITMTLPARVEIDNSRRGSETRPLVIRTSMTLSKGSRKIEMHTSFDHHIEDHRLRVMFPSGIAAATHSCAEGHFNVDKRPITPDHDLPEGYWPEMLPHPQQSWVDVSDGTLGLAIINDGLCEYEVMDNGERTIALTLLRAVKNQICTEFRAAGDFPDQKGGQSPGKREFKYAVYPHSGDWHKGEVYNEAQRFNIPVRPIQVGQHDRGKLPRNMSLLAIEPSDLVLSAFKQAEDSQKMVLRLFNPTAKAIEGKIRFGFPIKSAKRANLNEGIEGDLVMADKTSIDVPVGVGKIVTVVLEKA